MFTEGTCVCGFGPLRVHSDDAGARITYARTDRVIAANCPTCGRRLDGDELLPLPTLMLVGDDDLERVAQLLQAAGAVVDREIGDRDLYGSIFSEQSRRGGIRGAVDVDPRLVLARALADARRALRNAAHPGDEGQDCPAALHQLVAAIMGPAR